MNLWNKITIGAKFLFGGWESALDYLLGFLNDYLAKDGVAEKVEEIRNTCEWVFGWLAKIEGYIPEKWRNEYRAIMDVVADILTVTHDGKITLEEVKALAAAFAEAKAKWDED